MGAMTCSPTDAQSKQVERVRYFSRQLITADDLTQDQIYHRAKRRLHNRLLHGWGIICGLEVKKNPLPGTPLNVVICPGYALSPQGDEILVPMEVQFDVGQCIQGQGAPCHSPCNPVVLGAIDPSTAFYIGIRYIECQSRPMRVPPLGCGCDETACEYSRIRDSFEVSCLKTLPASYEATGESLDLCKALTQDKVIPCPPCLDDPWVVVTKVQLAPDRNSIQTFDVKDRRLVLSAAQIQAHIHAKCAER